MISLTDLYYVCDDCRNVVPRQTNRTPYGDESAYLCRTCAIKVAARVAPDRPVEPEGGV